MWDLIIIFLIELLSSSFQLELSNNNKLYLSEEDEAGHGVDDNVDSLLSSLLSLISRSTPPWTTFKRAGSIRMAILKGNEKPWIFLFDFPLLSLHLIPIYQQQYWNYLQTFHHHITVVLFIVAENNKDNEKCNKINKTYVMNTWFRE